MYQTGEVLSIPYRFYRHYMIVVGDGYVVHSSKEAKAVMMERLNDVCVGKQITNHGRWSRLSDAEIALQARNELGKPYRFTSWNCEHVIRRISGVTEVSTHVFLVGAALISLGTILWRRSKAA